MGYKQPSTVKLVGERPAKANGINYTVAPNALILDKSLTSDARLIAVYLLSLSDGWEINQEGIAEALGWPTKSNRVTKAMRNLRERGWLIHNEYKSGKRTFKHEFVMHRSRRLNAVDSTPYDESANQGGEPSYTVDSTPLYTVDPTPSPKYQRDQDSDLRTEAEPDGSGAFQGSGIDDDPLPPPLDSLFEEVAADDLWPEGFNKRECKYCGEIIYRDGDEYLFDGYAKWHLECQPTTS